MIAGVSCHNRSYVKRSLNPSPTLVCISSNLTRARQSMVIFVPEGDEHDRTRCVANGTRTSQAA
jgi:hypothetical protein